MTEGERMAGYDASTYGDRFAALYDDWPAVKAQDTEGAVARLAELASDGPVLELAVGTGRLALPLAARGIPVAGIDASTAMVERLRAKPGGRNIPVTIGDFTEVAVAGRFRLVFVAFNTFFALPSQDDQVRCFQNVAARLAPRGCFVLEAFVPDLARFDRGQRTATTVANADMVFLEAATHDAHRQMVHACHVRITEQGTTLHPVQLRYAWPSELDLMARLAGLRLRDRWGGWRGEPFTAASSTHVSVYERQGDAGRTP